MTHRFPTVLLFVPAHLERVRAKASSIQRTVFVLDIEDAVPPEQKVAARQGARAFLDARPGSSFVRINPMRDSTGFSTPCGEDDLIALVRPGLHGIVLPKTESARDVIVADAFIRALESERGLAPNSVRLLGIVETARGVAGLSDITGARPARPFGLCFGAGDFTTDIGVAWTREEEESRYARASLVVACRSAGLPAPIDSVFPDIRDTKAVEASARMARDLGFGGKFVIHPDQIAPVRQAFVPSEDETAWAHRVVDGMTEAEKDGRGAFTVDGRLVDYPIVERARMLLARRAEAETM
jgi:citrate lyase beta subunit